MITKQHGINIITAALIYNYLANNNYTLDMNIINEYVEVIKNNLLKKHQIYDIDLNVRTTNMYLDSFFIIGDARTNMSASLNLSSDLSRIYTEYIKYLPSELITESLNEDALKVIGVKKENLKICREIKVFNITHDIDENDVNLAREAAVTSLRKQGKEQVKVINCRRKNLDNNKGWYIDLSYIKPREYLDESVFIDMQKIKKKRFTSYYGF